MSELSDWVGKRFKCLKNGDVYTVISIGRSQIPNPDYDMKWMVAYQGSDGCVWYRFLPEFTRKFARLGT